MEIAGLRRLDYSTEISNLECRIPNLQGPRRPNSRFEIRNSNFLWHHWPVAITCRKMRAADVQDAFHMLTDFLSLDEHYLASSQAYGDLGLKGLNDALDLFL